MPIIIVVIITIIKAKRDAIILFPYYFHRITFIAKKEERKRMRGGYTNQMAVGKVHDNQFLTESTICVVLNGSHLSRV